MRTLGWYWNELKWSVDNFVEPMEPTTTEDEAAYQYQKQTLLSMCAKWQEIKKASIFSKKSMGDDLENISLNNFRNSGGVPPIVGKKSLALAEKVYLPHLARYQDIEESYFVAPFVNQKKPNAKKDEQILEKRIADYRAKHCPEHLGPVVNSTNLALFR